MTTIELPIKNNKLTVKAVTYKNYKTPLSVNEVTIPVTPGTIVKPSEILVQVKATSLNPVDCVLKGLNSGYFTCGNRIIGGDFSGVVVKAGSKTAYKEGDRIYGDILTIRGRGSASEYILFKPATATVCEFIPEGMTFEEAASLPIASATSFQCLDYYKSSLEGSNVLILGSGTSVGTYAVEFARHYFKASKIVTTCSPHSSERTIKCGADLTIDYTKGNTPKINEILEFVKLNGKFDIIVDTVRDESVIDYFEEILKPAKEFGVYTQVEGSYTIDYTDIKLTQLLPSWKLFSNSLKYKLGLSKFEIFSILLENNKDYGKAVKQLFENGKFIFSIDSIKDAYTQAEDAYQRVASGKSKGKVVLKF